ncbi:disease resistance protein (TIR-NBS-LRR class) [Trifolium pratense]|nr:disease resistance protein (TIR-NBS-LRR class) [Trifolium pratense]
MKSHRTTGKAVLPVFFDVDPSEVRHQKGAFGKAFQNLLKKMSKEVEEVSNSNLKFDWGKSRHENSRFQADWGNSVREIMEPRWREALREAAGLAGFLILNSR